MSKTLFLSHPLFNSPLSNLFTCIEYLILLLLCDQQVFNKIKIIRLDALGGCAECGGEHNAKASFFVCTL